MKMMSIMHVLVTKVKVHRAVVIFISSKAVFIIFPKLETRFNTHYQNELNS